MLSCHPIIAYLCNYRSLPKDSVRLLEFIDVLYEAAVEYLLGTLALGISSNEIMDTRSLSLKIFPEAYESELSDGQCTSCNFWPARPIFGGGTYSE